MLGGVQVRGHLACGSRFSLAMYILGTELGSSGLVANALST